MESLGQWILASSSLVSIGYMVGTALNAWRDQRIKYLELEVKKCQERDRRRKASLDNAWEYIHWMERNMVQRPHADPPPRPRRIPADEGEPESA